MKWSLSFTVWEKEKTSFSAIIGGGKGCTVYQGIDAKGKKEPYLI